MTTPLSGTNVRLLTGVPFSNDYKHTVYHDSEEDQRAYFNGKPAIYGNAQMNFQREEDRTWVQVPRHIDTLHNVNYMEFVNADYGNKRFYCFVTKLEYINKGNTRVHFEVDVIQTWMFHWKDGFKPSMVLREHAKLWVNNNPEGRNPELNTVEEGLDYGHEYDIVNIEEVAIHAQLQFLVIVCKEPLHAATDLKGVTPVINGYPQPLTFYLHPFYYQNGKAPTINGKQSLAPLTDVLKAVYKDEKAQKNVVSLYITSYTGINFDWDGTDLKVSMDMFGLANFGGDGSENAQTLYLKDLKKYSTKQILIGERYANIEMPKESKLLMHPYTTFTLTDFKGTRIDYRPEYLPHSDLRVGVRGSIGLSNKTSFGIINYNSDFEGEYIDYALNEYNGVDNSPNDVPILNDYLSAYLQGNRNSIANQKDSIVFNGVMNTVSGGLQGASSGFSSGVAGAGFGAINATQGAGNALLQLQGIEAKQKDLANLPPSMEKMGTNSYYDYGNNIQKLYIIRKQIKDGYKRKLSSFFNVYGYKTGRVKVPNFKTRENWNFVQTHDCVLKANFNNEDLQKVKSIFDSGITLWHTDDVGNYGLSNEVRT